MPMYITHQKEEYSKAFIHAIAAAAGYKVGNFSVDDNSVDCVLEGYKDVPLKVTPYLAMQLKCTEDPAFLASSTIAYDLKKKNFNDLCDIERVFPKILVAFFVPDNPQLWLTHSEEKSVLKHGAYWHSLRGESPITGTKKRVYLDRKNVLNPQSLRVLMDTIGNGGDI